MEISIPVAIIIAILLITLVVVVVTSYQNGQKLAKENGNLIQDLKEAQEIVVSSKKAIEVDYERKIFILKKIRDMVRKNDSPNNLFKAIDIVNGCDYPAEEYLIARIQKNIDIVLDEIDKAENSSALEKVKKYNKRFDEGYDYKKNEIPNNQLSKAVGDKEKRFARKQKELPEIKVDVEKPRQEKESKPNKESEQETPSPMFAKLPETKPVKDAPKITPPSKDTSLEESTNKKDNPLKVVGSPLPKGELRKEDNAVVIKV